VPFQASSCQRTARRWTSRLRALVALAVLALACATGAEAHDGGGHTGFVATVSGIEPQLPGLLVSVSGGHERLALRNLTSKTVVVFGEDGQPSLQLAPGRSGSVSDARIGSAGPPPEQGEFVKNWRIPGEAGGEPFEIVGFLGYRSPPGDEREDGVGVPAWAVVLAAGAGALMVVAALALPRRRKGEG
jgi:hypothetical protein